MITFVEACRLALDEALATDDSVFLLGEDISDDECGGVLKVTQGLSTKYGKNRVRSTPISEEIIVGTAVGAALAGMRPVAEIMFMSFLTLAMDQLHNHAAKARYMSGGTTTAPLTIRTAAGAGGQFGAHHSEQLDVWLAHSPGVKVAIPSSPADAKGLLSACIFDDDPCVFVEHVLLYYMGFMGPEPDPGFRLPLGQANVLRPGSDVTIVGYGKSIIDAQLAADGLAGKGIDVEIIDLRTLAPLDDRTVLESVAKTKRAVIVHESRRNFGVGAELSSRIHEELFSDLAAPVQRVGAKDTSVPFSTVLETAYLPSVIDITTAVHKTLEGQG
jgi:pyruvate dehydrogenase E1 component beta subunit